MNSHFKFIKLNGLPAQLGDILIQKRLLKFITEGNIISQYFQRYIVMFIRILLLVSLLPFTVLVKAQAPASADDLFKAARNAAFEEKDNNKAKQLALQALKQSPRYADIQVFLGRLYSWNKNYDSALYHYQQVIKYAPANEEVSIAYTDLECWNDHYSKALSVCNNGLRANPASEELLLRKAKILKALRQYKEALQITSQLLSSNKHNTAALALSSSLRDAAAINKLGVSYDYSHFDKQFNQPWHLISVGYSRYTKIGSVSTNINYANRFGTIGYQGEIEAYPHISRTFYSYLSFGYSPGKSIFPTYRAGLSLFANLPFSYEAEAGIRYLNFDNSTYIYTLYLGKYYSNFLFAARTYITPSGISSSKSFSILARYYLNSPDNYFGVSIGSGISPDDKTNDLQYSSLKKSVTTRQAAISLNHSFAKINIISLKAGLLNQEYNTNISGNRFDLSIGFQRRF